MVLQQVDGQWQKLAALIVWKLNGMKPVEITVADMEKVEAEFGSAGLHLLMHGKADSIEFSIVTAERAKVLVEHDAKWRGHA